MKSICGLVVSLCTIAGCAGIDATEHVDARITAYAQPDPFPGKRFVLEGPTPVTPAAILPGRFSLESSREL